MTTKTIDVYTSKVSLDDLLLLIRQGTEVIMTDANTQLARIVPSFAFRKERVAGLHAGVISTSDDFDEPLPDEFWKGVL